MILYLYFSVLVNNTAALHRVRALATLEKPPLTLARQIESDLHKAGKGTTGSPASSSTLLALLGNASGLLAPQ